MEIEDILAKYTYDKEVFQGYLIKDNKETEIIKYKIKTQYNYYDQFICENNASHALQFVTEITGLLNLNKNKIKTGFIINYEHEKYLIIYIRMLLDLRRYFLEVYFKEKLGELDYKELIDLNIINEIW